MKFLPPIGFIIRAQLKTYFKEFQPCKFYDQTCQFLCRSLVVNLVYYGQTIKDSRPIRKMINYLHVTLVVFEFWFDNLCAKSEFEQLFLSLLVNKDVLSSI